MRSVFSLLLYPLCLPADLPIAILELLCWAFWGENLRMEKRPGVDAKGKRWPGLWAMAWDLKPGVGGWYKYAATTLAPHVIVYRGQMTAEAQYWTNVVEWDHLREHEHTHSEQYEVAALAGAVLGSVAVLSGAPVLSGVLVWAAAQWAYMGGAYFVAILRGEDSYWGASTEEAAHAIDEAYGHDD